MEKIGNPKKKCKILARRIQEDQEDPCDARRSPGPREEPKGCQGNRATIDTP